MQLGNHILVNYDIILWNNFKKSYLSLKIKLLKKKQTHGVLIKEGYLVRHIWGSTRI